MANHPLRLPQVENRWLLEQMSRQQLISRRGSFFSHHTEPPLFLIKAFRSISEVFENFVRFHFFVSFRICACLSRFHFRDCTKFRPGRQYQSGAGIEPNVEGSSITLPPCPAIDGRNEMGAVNRLCNVIIHSEVKTLFTISDQGMRRHRNHRNLRITHAGTRGP